MITIYCIAYHHAYNFIVMFVQGQVQFYIEVVDNDDTDPDDHVDDIYVDISLSPSASFSQVMSYNGDHGNGRIELSFRVRCEESFYGQNCTTFCQPTDDSSGHYTCGPNGERICFQGYSGLCCDQPAATTMNGTLCLSHFSYKRSCL